MHENTPKPFNFNLIFELQEMKPKKERKGKERVGERIMNGPY